MEVKGYNLFDMLVKNKHPLRTVGSRMADIFAQKQIGLALSPELSSLVDGVETAFEMFSRLRNQFVDDSPIGQAQQLKSLVRLELNGSLTTESFDSHAYEFKALLSEYNDIADGGLSKQSPSLLFISSVPGEQFAAVFASYKGELTPTLETVIADCRKHLHFLVSSRVHQSHPRSTTSTSSTALFFFQLAFAPGAFISCYSSC